MKKLYLLAFAFLCPLSAFAQIPTLISSAQGMSTDTQTATTAAANSTGANLEVATVGFGNSSCTVSDSRGNNLFAVPAYNTSSGYFSQVFYKANPAVGTGTTVTVTCANPSSQPTINVAFFHTTGTYALDNQIGATIDAPATTITTGNATPSLAPNLFIGACAAIGSAAPTMTSLTLAQNQSSASGNVATALYWRATNALAAVNSSCTSNGDFGGGVAASLAVFSLSGCTGASPAWTANSWSALITCLQQANSGDKITVVPGSYTATVAINIFNNQYFNIVGAGVTILDSTPSNDYMIHIGESTAGSTHISGFVFNQNTQHVSGTSLGEIGVEVTSGGKPVLLSGMTWNPNNPSVGDFINMHTNKGVIWANVCCNISNPQWFDPNSCLNQLSFVRHVDDAEAGTAWSTPSQWGNADTTGTHALYVEGNTIKYANQAIDIDNGGIAVVRWNTFQDASVGLHGNDTGPIDGPRSAEFYGNTLLYDNGTAGGGSTTTPPNCTSGFGFNSNGAFTSRAGIMLIHHNHVDPTDTGALYGHKTEVQLFTWVLGENRGGFACWGLSPLTAGTYPAPHETGWGFITGATQVPIPTASQPPAFFGQDIEGTWIWANDHIADATGLDAPNIGDFPQGQSDSCSPNPPGPFAGPPLLAANFVQIGREVFTNVTNPSGKPSYTVAACPHALTGLTGSCNLTTYGITGYNISGAGSMSFTTQPSNTKIGSSFSPAVVVTLSNTHTDSITISVSTGLCTLTGTTTVNASSGVATFTGVGLTGSPTSGCILTAHDNTDSTIANATSISFNQNGTLSFSSQPTNTPSGGTFSPTVTVTMSPSGTDSITLSVSAGSCGLSGTTTVAAVGGVATYTGLGLTNGPTTGCKLTAHDGTNTLYLDVVSSSFNTTGSNSFTQQPTNTAVSSAFNPVVAGAITGGASDSVTASISSGSCTLSGTVTVSASSGVWTLTGVGVSAAGTACVMRIHDNTNAAVADIFSQPFNAISGSANIFYVDWNNGNDSNTCTQAKSISTPKHSIENLANSQCVSAGDTVFIRAGTYLEGHAVYFGLDPYPQPPNPIAFPGGLDPAHPTTFSGYPGDARPTLASSDFPMVSINQTDNVVWSGINIDGSNQPKDSVFAGPSVTMANNVVIQNLDVGNCPTNCMLVQDITNFLGANITLHNAANNWTPSNPGPHVIYGNGDTTPSSNVVWDHIEVFNNTGFGAADAVQAPYHYLCSVTVNDCISYDWTFRNSYFHDNTWAMAISGGGDPTKPPTKIYNNIFVNNGIPSVFGGTSTPGCAISIGYNTTTGFQIYNNTFYNNICSGSWPGGGYAIGYPGYGNQSNISIVNNIFWQNGNNDAVDPNITSTPGYFASNNLQNVDPGFVNAAINDFHLTASSAAIGIGTDLSTVFTTDRDGNTRTVPWDVGAYKSGSVAMAHLSFINQPTTTASGQVFSPVITVGISNGNADSIKILVNSGTCVLTGTTNVTASGGVAVFSGVGVTGMPATGCSLRATDSTDGTVLGATSINFSTTFQLTFSSQPTNTVAGGTFSPTITVAALPTSTDSMSLSVSTGNCILTGLTTVTAIAGTATFSGVGVGGAPTNGCRLTAVDNTNPGYLPAVSTAFNVTGSLAFSSQPTNVTTGHAFSPVITVTTTPSGTDTIALTVNAGTCTLGGTTSVAASGGVATFTGVTGVGIGSNCTLLATDTTNSLIPTKTSTAFNVSNTNTMAFSQQPTNTASGSNFSPTITVTITASVTDSIVLSVFSGGCTLTGTTTRSAVGGVATFAGLGVSGTPVNGCILNAHDSTNTAVLDVKSNGFNVTGSLAFSNQPSNTSAGNAFSPTITVATTPSSTDSITIAVTTGPCLITGTTTVSAIAGTATFTGVGVGNVGGSGCLITAHDNTNAAISNVVSTAFNVTSGTTPTMSFTVGPPPSTISGGVFVPTLKITFSALTVTDTVNLTANGCGTVLTGLSSRAAIAGIITYNNLGASGVAQNCTITAHDITNTNVADIVSNLFNVTGNPTPPVAGTPNGVLQGQGNKPK